MSEGNRMRRRWVLLLIGLGVGLCVGVGLTLLAQSFGWIGGVAPSPREERSPVRTTFVNTFSLAVAAQDALPGVPWRELWDHSGATYIFEAEGKGRRHGAFLRYCVIQNAGNHPVSPDEQGALNRRLVDAMVAALRAEGAEIFDAGQSGSSTETVVVPLPRTPDAKPFDKPNVRRFDRGQIGYRTKAVEGRVLSTLSGEGTSSVIVSVVIVEQPAESRFHRMD